MDINRNKAKSIIAVNECEKLSIQNIKEVISEYCIYDYASKDEIVEGIKVGDFPDLDREAIEYLLTKPEASETDLKMFKPVLIDYLILGLEKVTNQYLELRLKEIGYNYSVLGDPDKAGNCPCCSYQSISAGDEGLWEICPVCFWENGGDGPNHMSLQQAKENFSKIGAIDLRSKQFVDPEGPIKYAKKV